MKTENAEVILTPTLGFPKREARVHLWIRERERLGDAEARLNLRQARALAMELMLAADKAEGRKTPGPKPKEKR